MRILWDEPKRLANIDKHGLDFATLEIAFFTEAVVVPAKGGRCKAIGLQDGNSVTVIFAAYGREAISVISLRPASDVEWRLRQWQKQ